MLARARRQDWAALDVTEATAAALVTEANALLHVDLRRQMLTNDNVQLIYEHWMREGAAAFSHQGPCAFCGGTHRVQTCSAIPKAASGTELGVAYDEAVLAVRAPHLCRVSLVVSADSRARSRRSHGRRALTSSSRTRTARLSSSKRLSSTRRIRCAWAITGLQ